MIPYKVLYGKKPDIYYWQALGCCCWVYIPKEKHVTKLDSYIVKGWFISYANGFYKVYNIKNQKVIQSKDIKFQEVEVNELPSPTYNLDESTEHLTDKQRIQQLTKQQIAYDPFGIILPIPMPKLVPPPLI
jgi:hypothetical protein